MAPPDQPAADPPPADPSARECELGQWLVEHGPALRAYFRRKVSAAEADDLVQELFLAMHQRTAGEPIDNVQRYLFRVAANLLARRLGSGKTFASLAESAEPVDHFSPERILGGKESLARLMVAVRNLPPRSRTAFVLHRFEEMTYAAIAREMQISPDAVKGLLQRAMARLAEDLGSVR